MMAPTAEKAKNQKATSATLRTVDAERLRSAMLMGNPPQSVAYESPADHFDREAGGLPRATSSP
jgi:hypothetical protein